MKNINVDVKFKKIKSQEDLDSMLISVGTVKDICKIVAGRIDKHLFKVCEAVALGLTHYYMWPRDKREVTATERAEALATIPDLPEGWMKQKHDWDACIH